MLAASGHARSWRSFVTSTRETTIHLNPGVPHPGPCARPENHHLGCSPSSKKERLQMSAHKSGLAEMKEEGKKSEQGGHGGGDTMGSMR